MYDSVDVLYFTAELNIQNDNIICVHGCIFLDAHIGECLNCTGIQTNLPVVALSVVEAFGNTGNQHQG